MHYHPDLTAMLAQTRVADLHDAAARARHKSVGRGKRIAPAPAPTTAAVRLDAYPRLCGLPVTIDRLTADVTTPERPAEPDTPAPRPRGSIAVLARGGARRLSGANRHRRHRAARNPQAGIKT